MTCELCKNKDNRLIVLVDTTSGEILEEMAVCEKCREKFEFIIGAIKWQEE